MSGRARPLAPEVLRSARDLRELGLSYRAIAVALGYFCGVEMSPAQIRAALKTKAGAR